MFSLDDGTSNREKCYLCDQTLQKNIAEKMQKNSVLIFLLEYLFNLYLILDDM